jgi:hypothetical protein
MKLPAIKKLVENYTLEDCQEAEQDLLNGEPLKIEVEGGDEGEQLTHILGAIDIHQRIIGENKDPKVAIREFFERVRNSIS